jgi:hypothetical protein
MPQRVADIAHLLADIGKDLRRAGCIEGSSAAIRAGNTVRALALDLIQAGDVVVITDGEVPR